MNARGDMYTSAEFAEGANERDWKDQVLGFFFVKRGDFMQWIYSE